MEIVIFDTETTGLLLPDNAPIEHQPKIIEFYGVCINEEFEIQREFETYINPGEPISAVITKITGIKDSDVADAPTFPEVAPQIADLFEGSDLSVAHNLAFDVGMLKNEFLRMAKSHPRSRRNLCTVDHLRSHYGFRISLSALYKKLFGSFFKAHRARADVMALTRCFHQLTEDGVIDLEIYKN